jgi:LysM repeat protein
MTVDELKAGNNLTSDVIQPGQVLQTKGNILTKTGDLIRSTTGIGDGKPGALGPWWRRKFLWNGNSWSY